MSKDKQDLTSKVRGWLDEQGFPLEMEVAAMAKEAGFNVVQSEYYIDQDTGASREIDLVMSVSNFIHANEPKELPFYMMYSLYVECKSGDKPWVMFSNPNMIADDLNEENSMRLFEVHGAFIGNKLAKDLLMQSVYDGNLTNIYPRLNTEPSIGYGLAQALSQGSDAPYKAMMSATKAALYEAERANGLGLSTLMAQCIPVIVIDVPLYEVSFNAESNQLDVKEITKGSLLWRQVVGGQSRNGVYIVTKSAFPEFAARCRESSEWWLTQDAKKLVGMRRKFINK